MGIAVLAWALGMVWAWAKRQEWRARLADSQWEVALTAIEAGVQHAWDQYVKSRKSGGVKLTEQERSDARAIAKTKAIEIGKSMHIDVESIVGPTFDSLVERAVREAKGGKS